MISDKKKAAMAAHLCDLAAMSLRRGDVLPCASVASVLIRARWLVDDGSVVNYNDGLRSAGLASEEIDAAVAAIDRGEYPEGSIVGRVRKMGADAKTLAEALPDDAAVARSAFSAASNTCAAVLDLLGVTP